MYQNLSPKQLLDIGTSVAVNGGLKGIIVKAEYKPDQFNMPICLHTVEIREKYFHPLRRWKQIEPYQKNFNYASIQYI